MAMNTSRPGQRQRGPRRTPADRARPGNGAQPKSSYERYTTLAKAALAAGDHVGAENFFQHAEHYFRIMNKKPA